MVPEPNQNSSLIALRYLRNAVAWNSAIAYILNGVRISPSWKDITLHFVVTPIVSPDMCAPGEYFVDSGITHMLQKLSLDSQSETAKLLIEEFKTRLLPVKFSGTVHSEASLMGMMVACRNKSIPLPNGLKREELGAFEVLQNCIYVS